MSCLKRMGIIVMPIFYLRKRDVHMGALAAILLAASISAAPPEKETMRTICEAVYARYPGKWEVGGDYYHQVMIQRNGLLVATAMGLEEWVEEIDKRHRPYYDGELPFGRIGGDGGALGMLFYDLFGATGDSGWLSVANESSNLYLDDGKSQCNTNETVCKRYNSVGLASDNHGCLALFWAAQAYYDYLFNTETSSNFSQSQLITPGQRSPVTQHWFTLLGRRAGPNGRTGRSSHAPWSILINPSTRTIINHPEGVRNGD